MTTTQIILLAIAAVVVFLVLGWLGKAKPEPIDPPAPLSMDLGPEVFSPLPVRTKHAQDRESEAVKIVHDIADAVKRQDKLRADLAAEVAAKQDTLAKVDAILSAPIVPEVKE